MTRPSARAMELLFEIKAALEGDGPVEIGTMFRSPGLRTGNKIFAFLGHDDRLIVKLPHLRASALIDDCTVKPVTMGTRTMREWVSIRFGLAPANAQEIGIALAREALRYVRELPL